MNESAFCGRFKGAAPMVRAGYLMFQGYDQNVMVPAPCELNRCVACFVVVCHYVLYCCAIDALQ